MSADWKQTLAQFRERYGASGDYWEAWTSTREWFELCAKSEGKSDFAQGWRSVSGRVFENACRLIIEDALSKRIPSPPMRVMLWDDVPKDVREGVLSERVWIRGNVRTPQIVPSLVDVSVGTLDASGQVQGILAVYSCKTSVRERYQQDLFWVEKLRARGIKFCFVTIDEGFVQHASGVRTGPGDKSITLSKALYDRVYLLTAAPLVVDTRWFRPLSHVGEDLRVWLESL